MLEALAQLKQLAGLAGQARPGGGAAYTGPQIVVINYGQSNAINLMTVTSSPDAAASGTSAFAAGVWGAVPAGNGVRKLLNGIRSGANKTVGIISGGGSGLGITALMLGAGNGVFEALAALMVASGCANAESIVIRWQQGENEGNSANPNAATHIGHMDTIHGQLCAVVGKTRAQMPMFVSSLGHAPVDATWAFPDSSWEEINKALINANGTYANIQYTHSNKDAVTTDGIHWDAASQGRCGTLTARKILAVRGDVATAPNWGIASAAIVDATTTDVTLTHSMGTDFTPTSGISGFTLSIDNWATPVTPSAAVRQSATVIRLTHSSLAITDDRALRYQYGKTADTSAPVLDNGAVAAPLNHTAAQTLVAEGSGSLPVVTYKTSLNTTGSGATQTASGIDLAHAADQWAFFWIGSQSGGRTVTALTITPNGGSAINGTTVYAPATGTAPYGALYVFDIPGGTSGANNCAFSVTFNTSPSLISRLDISTIPKADLISTTPVDSDTALATATALTLNISSSADGVILAFGANRVGAAQSAVWTGDEPPIERVDYANGFGYAGTAADASGTDAGTNDNTITVTYLLSAAMRIVAVSLR